MDWMRRVCGRLGIGYRYSSRIVYNNFPWAEPSEAQRQRMEQAAQAVLAVRAAYPESTLADLYDPLAMPKVLLKAHRELDRAVDRCYRSKPFANEQERLEFLFELYETLNAEERKANLHQRSPN